MLPKRSLLKTITGMALAIAGVAAQAQTPTPIKFQLDWRFEGPSALFLLPQSKGYFKENKLDVKIDPGSGSGAAVQRVATGIYDMGFADMAALMEFHANNPDVPNKPVAIMMVYANTPAAVLSLKKSNINKPADLTGKKLGAPSFDGGRRAFPIFQKSNKVGFVTWVTMDPAQREAMLVRGEVDAITGFSFTSLLNLESAGLKTEDVVVMDYSAYDVKHYGNAIIASPKLIKENPAAVKAFLSAFTRGVKEVLSRPDDAIKFVKAREVSINESLEARRLKLAINAVINSADARADGFGQVNPGRLLLMSSQVSDAFQTKTRVKAADVWTDAMLPSKVDLNILPTTGNSSKK